jgi:hypothetical protein
VSDPSSIVDCGVRPLVIGHCRISVVLSLVVWVVHQFVFFVGSFIGSFSLGTLFIGSLRFLRSSLVLFSNLSLVPPLPRSSLDWLRTSLVSTLSLRAKVGLMGVIPAAIYIAGLRVGHSWHRHSLVAVFDNSRVH